MKISIINGSPKGDNSVTLQYSKYMFKNTTSIEYEVFNVGQQIHRIEKDLVYFQSIMDAIKTSDAVIWSYPVYVFTVASQLKRFIELIFERNCQAAFKEKYTCQILSSIHFYDHCAVNYINAICDDLEMKYVDFLSVHMHDLTKPEGRMITRTFGERFIKSVTSKAVTQINYAPLIAPSLEYNPTNIAERVDFTGKNAIIIADSLKDPTLNSMIETTMMIANHSFELIVLDQLNIKGGCIGCIKCGYNYECRYKGKDDFMNFYEQKVKGADIILFAGAIKDRYLSATWKRFLDRAFYNTHTPTLLGKHVGVMISGNLRGSSNLKQTFDAYFQWQKCHNSGYVTNEYETSTVVDQQILGLLQNISFASKENVQANETFLAVSAYKLFRDEIWGHLRFPFIADYKAYKDMNLFNFPQNDMKTRFLNRAMSMVTLFPKVRKEIYSNQIIPQMVKAHKKIVEDPSL